MSTKKICAHCGAENESEAKYCQQCGSQLAKEKGKFCPECGSKNEINARFCQNCGTVLNRKKSRAQKREVKKSKAPVLVIGGILGFFILFIFMKSIQTPATSNSSNQPVQPTEILSGDIALEASVSELANQFWCACGNCNDSLEKCACPKAQEERNLIRKELQKNTDKQQIVQQVKNKYGLFKADFKDFNPGN